MNINLRQNNNKITHLGEFYNPHSAGHVYREGFDWLLLELHKHAYKTHLILAKFQLASSKTTRKQIEFTLLNWNFTSKSKTCKGQKKRQNKHPSILITCYHISVFWLRISLYHYKMYDKQKICRKGIWSFLNRWWLDHHLSNKDQEISFKYHNLLIKLWRRLRSNQNNIF